MEKKEFRLTRTFNAPLDLVWKANTEEEHLAKWWGPKGLKMIHCKLDLKPGGTFHYGMEAPNGDMMWGKFVYREIQPKTKLVYVVSFSDKDMNITRHPMAPTWPAEMLSTLLFSEKDGKTTITLLGGPLNASPEESKLYFDSFASMNEGFKGTFDALEEYLRSM